MASWAALSVAGVVVACPGGSLDAGSLGSRLVVNAERVPAIILIYNEGDEAWQDVTVVVNRQYRGLREQVPPGRQPHPDLPAAAGPGQRGRAPGAAHHGGGAAHLRRRAVR